MKVGWGWKRLLKRKPNRYKIRKYFEPFTGLNTKIMNKDEVIKRYLAQIGKKGGSATGPSKARILPPEHYEKVSRAMKERWERWRKKNKRDHNA